jgi:hypothetical protein
MARKDIEDAARQELEQIKALGQQGTQIVAEALHRLSEFMAAGRWGPLGYSSATEFLDTEFPGLAQYAIPAEQRRELVARLAGKEPQKAIAARLGVSQQTVSLDLGITNIGNSAGDGEKRGRGRPRKPRADSATVPAGENGSAQESQSGGKVDSVPDPGQDAPGPAVHAYVFEKALCGMGGCNLLYAGDAAGVTCRRCLAMGGYQAAQERLAELAAAPEIGALLRAGGGHEEAPGTPVPGEVTVTTEPVADHAPEPAPCPGCQGRDEQIADLQAALEAAHARIAHLEQVRPDALVQAERDHLAALVREQVERIDELEKRLSGRQVGPGQEDPGNHPQDLPEAADSAAPRRDEAPVAQAPGRVPCGRRESDKVVFTVARERKHIGLAPGRELEWLCRQHRAAMAAALAPAGGQVALADDPLSFEYEPCQYPVPVTSEQEIEDLHEVPA